MKVTKSSTLKKSLMISMTKQRCRKRSQFSSLLKLKDLVDFLPFREVLSRKSLKRRNKSKSRKRKKREKRLKSKRLQKHKIKRNRKRQLQLQLQLRLPPLRPKQQKQLKLQQPKSRRKKRLPLLQSNKRRKKQQNKQLKQLKNQLMQKLNRLQSMLLKSQMRLVMFSKQSFNELYHINRSKKTKSKGTKSQVSSMRGGSKFMMKHIQNQLNGAQNKLQQL